MSEKKEKRLVDPLWEWIQINPWRLSLLEATIVFLISNIPFSFLIFLTYLHDPGVEYTWSFAYSIIASNVKSGEVLIYICALLAPTVWVMMHHWRARKHELLFWIVSGFSVASLVIAGYMFGADRRGQESNENFATSVALLLYIGMIITWYLGLVFSKMNFSDLAPKHKPSGKDVLDGLRSGGSK